MTEKIAWMLAEEIIEKINRETNKAMSDYANATEGNFTDKDMAAMSLEGEYAKCKAQARKVVEEIHKHIHYKYCGYCLDPIYWEQLQQQVLEAK